ncbi:MAG: hypothetical protein HY561_06270 [Gemmatimonadetes bacterium]|nr:hypothetical protein [Gemmatimonadota bacterium]
MKKNSEVPGRVAQRGFALRSVEDAAAKLSVVHEQDGFQILVVELTPAASLAAPWLWAGSSWHLVMEGQAVFQQGARTWELLPAESLSLRNGASYVLRNPAPGRTKLLSVLFQEGMEPQHQRPAMTTGQKTILWGLGILLWTELLSICLSTWRFGWIDWPTVAAMALITLPLLGAGALLLHRLRPDRRVDPSFAPEETEPMTPLRAVAGGGWK